MLDLLGSVLFSFLGLTHRLSNCKKLVLIIGQISFERAEVSVPKVWDKLGLKIYIFGGLR